jgi:S1-C subfamily serine protease
MRVLYWIAAGLVAVLMALVVMGLSSTKADDTRAESVVKVMLKNGHGSGVHIGNGFVITAAHVAKGHAVVTLKNTIGDIQDAEVLWVNENYDVALLRAARPERLGVSELACRVPAVGETISSYGYPKSLGFTSLWGRVARGVADNGHWRSAIVGDISGGPGQSGGPVLDDVRRVVGIVVGGETARLGRGGSFLGLAYIVPGKTICNLLARGT